MMINDATWVVGLWAKDTFPNQTADSILTHLEDEVGELLEAHGKGVGVGEEVADCLILLLCYAYYKGIDVEASFLRKHRRNGRRKWGAPDARGVHRHVGETEAPA